MPKLCHLTMIMRAMSLPCCLAVLAILWAPGVSRAGQGSTADRQPEEQEPQEEKPGRVIFALTPLPEPDPRAVALDGRRISAITISGNRITKEHVVRRELALRVGEPFDVETMMDDIVRLENLGIFSTVAIDLTDLDESVGVEVAVQEMPWVIPYVAFRVSDQDSIQLGPAVSSLNLFG